MRFSSVRTDVHQHLWSESLVAALASRPSPPRAGRAAGGLELVLSAEPRSPLALDDPARRAALLAGDGVERALIALSSAYEPDQELAATAPARLFGWRTI